MAPHCVDSNLMADQNDSELAEREEEPQDRAETEAGSSAPALANMPWRRGCSRLQA